MRTYQDTSPVKVLSGPLGIQGLHALFVSLLPSVALRSNIVQYSIITGWVEKLNFKQITKQNQKGVNFKFRPTPRGKQDFCSHWTYRVSAIIGPSLLYFPFRNHGSLALPPPLRAANAHNLALAAPPRDGGPAGAGTASPLARWKRTTAHRGKGRRVLVGVFALEHFNCFDQYDEFGCWGADDIGNGWTPCAEELAFVVTRPLQSL